MAEVRVLSLLKICGQSLDWIFDIRSGPAFDGMSVEANDSWQLSVVRGVTFIYRWQPSQNRYK